MISGEWIGVMDGDRVFSGDLFDRFVFGFVFIFFVVVFVLFLGVFLGVVKCFVFFNWCFYSLRKRSDVLLVWERYFNFLFFKLRWFCIRLNRVFNFFRVWIKFNICIGKLVFVLIFISGVVLMCRGVIYIYGGNGLEEFYLFNG